MASKNKLTQVLLVEGKDDQHVIFALCEKLNVTKSFEVVDCKGIDNLIETLPVRFKQSDFDTIGIVVDADTDIKARWDSIKGLLAKQGLNVLDDLEEDGLILKEENKITVGVWIMPNNQTNGILEDFISFFVPEKDPLLPLAKTTLETIENQQLRLYSPNYHSKSLIHTWLAWQKDPGTPMGLAITKKFLSADMAICQRFIDWLNHLFNPTPA